MSSSGRNSLEKTSANRPGIPKPHTTGLTGEKTYHIWQLIDGEELTQKDLAMLLEVLSDKTKVELMDPANENTPEYQKALRVFYHFKDLKAKRPYFRQRVMEFDRTHRWRNYEIADFFPKEDKDADVKPTDCFNYQRYLQLADKYPGIEIECYNYRGNCVYRVADGEDIPLQKWDDFIAEQNAKAAEEAAKKEEQPKPEKVEQNENMSLMAKFLKLQGENEDLRRDNSFLSAQNSGKDTQITRLQERVKELEKELESKSEHRKDEITEIGECQIRPDLKWVSIGLHTVENQGQILQYRWVNDEDFQILCNNDWLEAYSIDFVFNTDKAVHETEEVEV